MLVGHFAVGLAAKRIEPAMSVGTLVLASMLADLLWCVLMFAGIERVQFKPGIGAANYFGASDIVISHSLLMDGLWAALMAAAYLLKRRNPRGAWVIFGAVLSHWLLDWISHRPDMPLSPGVHRYVGLGLWSSIPAALIIEGGLGPRGHPLRPRHSSQNTCRRVRVLERCRGPYPGVVQQSRRASTFQSSNGAAYQPSFLFPRGGMGLLDEHTPALVGEGRLTCPSVPIRWSCVFRAV
jgi:hypothetical protein